MPLNHHNSTKWNTIFADSITEKIWRKVFSIEDYFFQKRYSLDLDGIVQNIELGAVDKESMSHATAYQSVWTSSLRELFIESQKTGYKFENFIDIGSGKGKACFYAQNRGIFNNVVGIEFSKKLVDVANKNKLKIKSDSIKFIHTDATQYLLPDGPNFVFMFNPFDRVVLEKFILNNIINLKNNNTVIGYANDCERMTLTDFGFETIFRNQTRKISLFQIS